MKTLTIELPAPHAAQVRVVEEAGRFNVLECGRRWGKTTLGESLLIEPSLKGQPTAWFAPTYKYLSDVWRRVTQIVAPITKRKDEQEHRIDLITGGVLDFWTLDKPDAGRGRKYARGIIDEAGIVRDLQACWQESIRPTLTDLKGDAWFLGTPKGRKFFHQLFTKGEQHDGEWRSWRMPTTANPNIDPSEVEAARRDLPKSVFDQEFLGIPADDGGNPFGMAAIASCVAPLSEEEPVAFGVDLAKSQDWTVVIGLDAEGRVCVAERWQSDWAQTRRRVLELIGSTPTLIDSTGVGDPIVEDIIRERGPSVEGFKFTATSKQQLMEGLAAGIQRGETRFPDGWLRSELESFEYEYRRGGGVSYSAPEGLHDDGVCALALAFRKLNNAVSIEVRLIGGEQTRERDPMFDSRIWQEA